MSFIFDKEKKVLYTETIILAQGEENATTLDFPLSIDEENEYEIYLEFKLPQGKKFLDNLVRGELNYKYLVPKFLTGMVGKIDLQLVMYKKDDSEIYKTIPIKGKIIVVKSINASSEDNIDLTQLQYDTLVSIVGEKVSNVDIINHNSSSSAHSDIREELSVLNVLAQSKIDKSAILQTLGTNEDKLISQKVITNAIAGFKNISVIYSSASTVEKTTSSNFIAIFLGNASNGATVNLVQGETTLATLAVTNSICTIIRRTDLVGYLINGTFSYVECTTSSPVKIQFVNSYSEGIFIEL